VFHAFQLKFQEHYSRVTIIELNFNFERNIWVSNATTKAESVDSFDAALKYLFYTPFKCVLMP